MNLIEIFEICKIEKTEFYVSSNKNGFIFCWGLKKDGKHYNFRRIITKRELKSSREPKIIISELAKIAEYKINLFVEQNK